MGEVKGKTGLKGKERTVPLFGPSSQNSRSARECFRNTVWIEVERRFWTQLHDSFTYLSVWTSSITITKVNTMQRTYPRINIKISVVIILLRLLEYRLTSVRHTHDNGELLC